MSTQPSESPGRSPYPAGQEGWGRREVARWERGLAGMPTNWLITGLVVLGLGILAWRHFGPDFERYMKIRNM